MTSHSGVQKYTVDMVALCLHEGQVHILLIQRAHPPFEGSWALPGGHVDVGEDLHEAALRELAEETHLGPPTALAQVGSFGDPKRDPRGHVISTAFVGLYPQKEEVKGDDDAKEARWFSTEKLGELSLAFDHRQIIEVALSMVQVGSWTGRPEPARSLKLRPEVLYKEELLRRNHGRSTVV